MEQRKRKSEDAGAGSKTKRKKYFANPSKNLSLPLGSKGYLISCIGGKEWQAAREAINVLTEYHEALQPSEAKQADATIASDISSLIADEIAELKDQSSRLLTYHKTNVSGLIYLSLPTDYAGPSPSQVVLAAAKACKETQQCKTRLCLKFNPVEHVCHASLDAIQKLAKQILPDVFPAGDDTPCISFSVAYEHRATAKMDRMKVINSFVDLIPQPPHKVNLDQPQKTILVQIMKTSCAVSIVDDYKTYQKYNFKELATPPDDDEEASGDAQVSNDGVVADDVVAGEQDDSALPEPVSQPEEAEERGNDGKVEKPKPS